MIESAEVKRAAEAFVRGINHQDRRRECRDFSNSISQQIFAKLETLGHEDQIYLLERLEQKSRDWGMHHQFLMEQADEAETVQLQ